MKYFSLLALAVAGLVTTSCSTRVGDMTVVSTKNMDIKHLAGYTTEYNKRTTGEYHKHILIFFYNGFLDMKEPIDRAIEKNGPNCVGLANVTITNRWWYIPFIYGQDSYIVEGDPIFRKD